MGAKRLLAYYVRLYGIRANGSYVRLAADETDRYDVGGAVGLRTPAAYTSSAPCDLRVKFGLGGGGVGCSPNVAPGCPPSRRWRSHASTSPQRQRRRPLGSRVAGGPVCS